jgi:hypothetical protein
MIAKRLTIDQHEIFSWLTYCLFSQAEKAERLDSGGNTGSEV